MLKAFATLENRAVRRRLVALTEQLVAAQSGVDADIEGDGEDEGEPTPAAGRESRPKGRRS
jgi:hypothetical protein